ncbi:MAG: threo-3-hydroxy-L-aspartate ammonia-lyase [Desulfobacteraceae bacterium]|nr:MAG: threo-3-hydroxy-L-aspartate ammonia-lyase [Desulfobacteraceae bacterium]
MEQSIDELFEMVKDAAARVNGVANVTPVMTSRTLNECLGAEVFLKCENLQRIGAFKFRGAYNAMTRLSAKERARGVLTFSSGNHAQAVALTGRLLGIATTVVMPQDAPLIKREATRAYGATVIAYDPRERSREAIARELQEEKGFTLIPPYDHLDVVAGQGTAALELCGQAGRLDMLLVPCGGGGLLSGCAIAAKGMNPDCTVIGVEPELADDATRSFYTRTLQRVENPPTIADGTRTPSLGKITFPLVLQYVSEMHTVSEEAIKEAVRVLFYRQKLVVEPSGALGLAALLSGKVKARGRVGVILSGGNIDGPTMRHILNG